MTCPKECQECDLRIPDDIITMNVRLYNTLTDMFWEEDWQKGISKEEYIATPETPVDIMLSNQIPLPDFFIEWKDPEFSPKMLFNTNNKGVVIHTSNEVVCFHIREDGQGWEMEIGESFRKKPIDQRRLEKYGQILLGCWYGIQLCLLHPTIKEIFQHPTVQKEYVREGKGKDRRRVTRYIRKHYITAKDIDEALHSKGNFTRKTMAWYVIGHWREYKNGRRMFIKGHWRGPLREAKKSFDGGRVRELEGLS